MEKELVIISQIYVSTREESAEEQFGRDMLRLASEGWLPSRETSIKKGLFRRRGLLVEYKHRSAAHEEEKACAYEKPKSGKPPLWELVANGLIEEQKNGWSLKSAAKELDVFGQPKRVIIIYTKLTPKTVAPYSDIPRTSKKPNILFRIGGITMIVVTSMFGFIGHASDVMGVIDHPVDQWPTMIKKFTEPSSKSVSTLVSIPSIPRPSIPRSSIPEDKFQEAMSSMSKLAEKDSTFKDQLRAILNSNSDPHPNVTIYEPLLTTIKQAIKANPLLADQIGIIVFKDLDYANKLAEKDSTFKDQLRAILNSNSDPHPNVTTYELSLATIKQAIKANPLLAYEIDIEVDLQ